MLAITLIGTLLHYGTPNPLSSSKTLNPIKSHPMKKSVEGAFTSSMGFNLSEAKVDITTKDLYDRIEFLNIDGGP
jgi:alpha-mannosidase II